VERRSADGGGEAFLRVSKEDGMSKLGFLVLAAVVLGAAAGVAAPVEPHGGMLRYPDVSDKLITFLYANDLWVVPKEGGVATPLASPPGEEAFPRFSPDGKTIAFVGNYDGDVDLYTIPVTGGVPFRVTHHPADEVLTDWTPDGRLIFFSRGFVDYPRAPELFTVSAEGGMPEKLPVPYGANAAISADGQWLAYTPHSRDMRTWKRYRGGMATDIWLFDLKKHTSKKITNWEGTDSQPMWHGKKVYYMSDGGPEHRLNIWVYDTVSGENRQVTNFSDYDIKWPAIGPDSDGQGEIVFQHASDIYLLDLATEKAHPVSVTIPGDRPKIRVQAVDVSKLIFSSDISSTGKRVVAEARGDIWTLPAKKGPPIDLTRTSGSAERSPSWSPDGKWIAYFSDESGEYELYVIQSDGRTEPRRVTNLRAGFLYRPVWSPDSKKICFWDQTGTLHLAEVESGTTKTVDKLVEWGRAAPVSWSGDSKWIAYPRAEHMIAPTAIWLYDVEAGTTHRVTGGMFNDSWPVFDREGKYLYFASAREFSSPMYEDLGTTWIYAKTDRLYAVPLNKDVKSPLLAESDDETWKAEGDKKSDEKPEAKDKTKSKSGDKGAKEGKALGDDSSKGEEKKIEPVKIDLAGFEERAVLLPVSKGNFGQLAVSDEGKLVYARYPFRGEDDGEGPAGRATVQILDLKAEKEDEKEKTVISGVMAYAMSADGKKLLVVGGDHRMAIVDAKPDQKMEDIVPTTGMVVQLDPRAEWRQIFRDAWRIQRDFFYDPNMHGVDWEGVRKQYEPMIEDCASREDVSYVIREMIAELNVGHAYYWGGDVEDTPSMSVGMPGCDFRLENGAYRISRILEGGPWDVDGRGPLAEPGVGVKEGDYLLAVNGVPVDAKKDPWAAFEGLANRTVVLTVSEDPKMSDKARQAIVKLGGDEYDLRYRAWVEKNRKYVDEKSNGRVGYIYVPDTSIPGQNELVRQFYEQLGKDALIVDERWNAGGQVPTRFVELLNRPIANYWALRDRDEVYPWPPDANQGPKCMLINGLSGSGGDYFPFWFRAAGVGKLIGTRTWGGLVGISGNPALIDGGYTSAPTFAFFKKNGTWGIEGHGVDPDIEVVDDPALMFGGKDPQLDAAIDYMLQEIARNPYKPPKRPEYPNRRGMGVREEDK
jgi:tricorn protease